MFSPNRMWILAVLALTVHSALCFDHRDYQQFEGRIFGGNEAAPGQFPYQISLRVNTSRGFQHTCGGTIISERFVVTAAHCFNPNINDTSAYRVVVGAHERNGNDGEVYNIENFYIHPEFNLSIIIHDIAVIELADDLEFSQNVSRIALATEFVDGGVRAKTSGWGRTNDEVENLKYAYLYTLSNEDCRERHESGAPIHDFSTLCAFSGTEGTGVCSGDSGGPLVHHGELIGVTSWASLCALGVPDGFTRVSEYVDWIRAITVPLRK